MLPYASTINLSVDPSYVFVTYPLVRLNIAPLGAIKATADWKDEPDIVMVVTAYSFAPAYSVRGTSMFCT